MTISTTDTQTDYAGDGVTQQFSFAFAAREPQDVTVLLTNTTQSEIEFDGSPIAGGGSYQAILNVDYTVSLSEPGGTVDFGTSEAPASGLRITVRRSTALTQDTDYTPGDPFPAQSHEEALDKLTLIAQELQRGIDFSVRFPLGDDPATHNELPLATERAGKVLTFDAQGNPTTGKDLPVATVSNFAETLLDDTDAPTARGTLGLGSIATQSASSVNITGGSISGINDLAVADGGTGASTPSGARSNLGLVIGSDVQGYDAGLNDIAGLSPNLDRFIVGNGSNWIAENRSQARVSLGLGDLATLNQPKQPTLNAYKVFDSDTTWSRETGTVRVIVEVLGGGGGGGGAAASNANDETGIGGGGGAGGYAIAEIDVSSINSASITVGSGGSGGSAGGNSGSAGGNSEWSDGTNTVTGNGGNGGGTGGPSNSIQFVGNSASGGNASGGDVNVTGEGSVENPSFAGGISGTGPGGSTIYGSSPRQNATTGSKDGGDGNGFGSGGTGGVSTNNAGNAAAGGNGGPGIVIVREYK
jgi:hypothetical protein